MAVTSPNQEEHYRLIIPEAFAGQRLDQAVAAMLPHLSRSRIQQWIKEGQVQVVTSTVREQQIVPANIIRRAKDRVYGNEVIEIFGILKAQTTSNPQPIQLDICYQDADLLVINKPPGLVVHPGAGNLENTLQNGLLYWDADLIRLPRCGIVHRLDKDTSGLMVVARSLRAHTSLTTQLQTHAVQREYLAVVCGIPIAGDTVDLPIGRHPTRRTHMAVTARGRPAVTHFKIQERFQAHSLLAVKLATGRTHQIRVHLSHIKLPLVGDQVYSGRSHLPPGLSPQLRDHILSFPRQALHAQRLSLAHPNSGDVVTWEVPPPADMVALISLLRAG